MADALSRDAEIAALMFQIIPTTTLKFMRPHIIHPRSRAALDELTAAGLLLVTQDPRGPMEWRAAPALSDREMFKRPAADEGFPMTIKEDAPNG